MTYCTLEEAWGTNFEKKKKKKQPKKKKEEIEHFENTTNDNNTNNTIPEKIETPQESYLYDFSRSPYTLPEHNGNDERINIQDKYTIDNSHLDDDENEDENEKTTLKKIPSKNDDDSNSLIEKINELLVKYEYNQGNTTQEVVLFALIGIFIIFVLDTFVKIGKMYN